jgi:hypothetical protein
MADTSMAAQAVGSFRAIFMADSHDEIAVAVEAVLQSHLPV